MILNFGKWKGYDICQVPEDYLVWLISLTQKNLDGYKGELTRRDADKLARLSTMDKIIQAGYRALAMQNHPDHGGSTVAMQDINASYEKLKVILQRAR